MKAVCGNGQVVDQFISIFNESTVDAQTADHYATAIAKLQAARPSPDIPEADALAAGKTAYIRLTNGEKTALKLVMNTWRKAIPEYQKINTETAKNIKLTYTPKTRYTQMLQQLSASKN